MTTGRTPAEAVAKYQSGIQRLLSCVSNSVVSVAGGYYPSSVPHSLIAESGLLRGASRLMLTLEQYYRIAEPPSSRTAPWQVEIVGYDYAVYDSDEREILLYHWHPHGGSPIALPHLHLGSGAQVGRREVRDAHLPTGHIPLSALLRLLIVEMGVQPRRQDWDTILSEGDV